MHRGLREQVYDRVLDMLTQSGIEPGSRLSIGDLAQDLGVSPTPVREALIQLERTGLITREIHKGYRVAEPLSVEQLETLFDTRTVLEGGAIELAARYSVNLIPRLTEALEAQRDLGERIERSREPGERLPTSMLQEYFRADWDFHRVIFEEARNPFLLDMSDVISSRVHRMRQVSRSGWPDGAAAIREHETILAALQEDPAQAIAAMRDHIARVRGRAMQDAAD